jgi:hypothetical protein
VSTWVPHRTIILEHALATPAGHRHRLPAKSHGRPPLTEEDHVLMQAQESLPQLDLQAILANSLTIVMRIGK